LKKIAIMCPSRERSHKIKECIDCFYDNSSGLADLIISIDDDDSHKEKYREIVGQKGVLVEGPSMKCCPKLQWTFDNYVKDDKDIVVTGFIGDDTLCRTPRWDEKVLEEVDKMKGWGILHVNDLYTKERHAIHTFMTTNIPRAMGYFAHEGLIHVFIDNMWDTLGRKSGLMKFTPDIIFEHMHPANGHGGLDRIYNEGNSRLAYSEGQRVYDEWISTGEIDEDIKKIMVAKNG